MKNEPWRLAHSTVAGGSSHSQRVSLRHSARITASRNRAKMGYASVCGRGDRFDTTEHVGQPDRDAAQPQMAAGGDRRRQRERVRQRDDQRRAGDDQRQTTAASSPW